MKGITQWNADPFVLPDRREDAELPHIVRLAPYADFIELEWLDKGFDGPHFLQYRPCRTDSAFAEIKAEDSVVRLEDLAGGTDYEIVLRRDTPGGAMTTRLARTGEVPGVIVNYLHPDDPVYAFSGRYLCTPSLVKLPSGRLVASMDVYAKDAPQNLSMLFYSEDGGANWRYLTQLFPCYWGKLFVHKEVLYLLSQSTEYGDLLIGASYDEGHTFTPPVRLFSGSCKPKGWGPHHQSMPILRHNGRLFTSCEYGGFQQGRRTHAAGVLSVSVDADLLSPESWELSDFLYYDESWKDAPTKRCLGMMEGSIVLGPDGTMYNIMRVNIAESGEPTYGKALLLRVDPDHPGRMPKFERFVDMPGACNARFSVYRDPVTKKYVSIVNEIKPALYPDGLPLRVRNVASLAVSENLLDWKVVRRLHDYSHLDTQYVGMQYIDLLIDGDDLFYLSRTALNGASNFHDTNYSTFHVLRNFRQYLS